MPVVSTLETIVLNLVPTFTAPSGQLFVRMIVGWILCPTRRTITAMIPFADPDRFRCHDAYHRFFRAGAWCVHRLFRAWAAVLLRALCPEGTAWLVTDDTVHKKTGRKMNGAGFFRDAVRSTGQRTIHVWGIQIVPVCLRVVPPWGGEPLALPIAIRIYRKGGRSLLDLVEAMVNDLAAWFPDRRFRLAVDGLYAPLAGRKLTRTDLTSRMRRDAALYELPPKRRAGQRGRPRKRGKRLPCPEQMAKTARNWKKVHTTERGKKRERLIYARPVLWYAVEPDRQVLLVISRDPTGKERDDFFFTTDLNRAPGSVIEEFANRWAIEDTFRNVKQFLGAEQPQSWRGRGPQRAAALAYLLYGVIWLWYLKHGYRSNRPISTPWYSSKSTPSFKDALAALRTALWRKRFFHALPRKQKMNKFDKLLIHALSRAA